MAISLRIAKRVQFKVVEGIELGIDKDIVDCAMRVLQEDDPKGAAWARIRQAIHEGDPEKLRVAIAQGKTAGLDESEIDEAKSKLAKIGSQPAAAAAVEADAWRGVPTFGLTEHHVQKEEARQAKQFDMEEIRSQAGPEEEVSPLGYTPRLDAEAAHISGADGGEHLAHDGSGDAHLSGEAVALRVALAYQGEEADDHAADTFGLSPAAVEEPEGEIEAFLDDQSIPEGEEACY